MRCYHCTHVTVETLKRSLNLTFLLGHLTEENLLVTLAAIGCLAECNNQRENQTQYHKSHCQSNVNNR